MNDGRLWRIATFAVVGISVIALLAGVVWLAVTAQTLRDQLAASQANAQELYEQLLEEGVEPAGEAPDDVADEPIPTNGKDGTDGVDGRDGPPPSDEQTLAAVQRCFATGLCVAPKGDTGSTGGQGEPGADSNVPGPAGAAGVGIAVIECLDDGTWRFILTDGTTSVIPGPCRITPTPEPTPETPEGDTP